MHEKGRGGKGIADKPTFVSILGHVESNIMLCDITLHLYKHKIISTGDYKINTIISNYFNVHVFNYSILAYLQSLL